MIETYRIMQGVDKVDRGKFFSLSHNIRTRGYPLILSVGRVGTDKRKYFFIQCVISLWNSLPQNVVMASGLDAFKRGIGEIPGGKVHHRLQAVIGMYNIQT